MNIISRAVAALLPLLLAACLNQTSAPSAAPASFTVTPGESRVILNWTSEPGLIYWVYYKAGSTVSKDDFTAINYKVTAPVVIGNLTNGTQYAFLVTASDDNSETGPASDVETAIPRLVGATSDWKEGPRFTTNNLTGIAFGNNHFVAVGDTVSSVATVFSATHSYTSPDGVATDTGWSSATTLPAGFAANLSAVIYDGARFVALGTDGSIITSTDTATWIAGKSIGSAGMNALAHGTGNTYIAVGDGGAIYKNTTAGITDAGAAWTVETSGTTNDLYGVSYVNGIFVAVGAGGTLLTSTDGDSWVPPTTISPSTSSILHQVAFGAGTYVAVGDDGTIVYSADATNWTSQSITTQHLRTICFGPDAQFIAAGTAGTIAYSTTGQSSWSVSDAGVADQLNSIVPSDVFIAVGAAGVNVSVK